MLQFFSNQKSLNVPAIAHIWKSKLSLSGLNICLFYLYFIFSPAPVAVCSHIDGISLGFGHTVKQNKQFKDVTFDLS